MSRRVLVVDDHVGFRANMRSLLCSLPGEYEVVGEAGNATKALQSVEALRPEIVVLDVSLPDASGLDVARDIRSRFPNTRIIMLTQYDLPEYRTAAYDTQVYAFIAKVEFVRELPRVLEALGQMSDAPMGFQPAQSSPSDNASRPFPLPVMVQSGFSQLEKSLGAAKGWLEARIEARQSRWLWGNIHLLVAILCVQIVAIQANGGIHNWQQLVALTTACLAILTAVGIDLTSLLRSVPEDGEGGGIRTHKFAKYD